MSQELAIIKQENIQTIVSAAPQSYHDNNMSREKCIAAGQAILDAIQAQGMSDELDQQAAVFIEKARKTVKKMNERRSPVTKLFDDIRKEFTAIENAIDPAKANTVPAKLQELRNQFAAKRHAEEEQRRRAEYLRQQAEQARARAMLDTENQLKALFNQKTNADLKHLADIFDCLTLDNYDASFAKVNNFSTELPPDFMSSLFSSVRMHIGITPDYQAEITNQLTERFAAEFTERYRNAVADEKQYILDRMPSKRTELQRIAKADAEEAARIKAEMEARQRKEAEEQEAERRRKEEEEKQMAEMARQQSEMESLFSQQATMEQYQPKTKVTKKINLLSPDGIMPIISLWWSKEGCRLSIDELAKLFKKQITFCERLANKDDIFLDDKNISYTDNIKAK